MPFIAVIREVHIQLVRILHAKEAADDGHFGGMAFLHRAGNRNGSRRRSSGFERLKNLRGALDGEIFVEIVIHLHGGRAGAGADAFDFFEGKHAVLGGFLVADFQFFLDEFVELVAAAQHAGDVGADLHVIFSGALAAQHRVIRHRFGDLQRIQAEAARRFRRSFRR